MIVSLGLVKITFNSYYCIPHACFLTPPGITRVLLSILIIVFLHSEPNELPRCLTLLSILIIVFSSMTQLRGGLSGAQLSILIIVFELVSFTYAGSEYRVLSILIIVFLARKLKETPRERITFNSYYCIPNSCINYSGYGTLPFNSYYCILEGRLPAPG